MSEKELASVYDKDLYFQESYICVLYYNDTNGTNYFETNYPLTFGLIEETDACLRYCQNPTDALQCFPYYWHDGMLPMLFFRTRFFVI